MVSSFFQLEKIEDGVYASGLARDADAPSAFTTFRSVPDM